MSIVFAAEPDAKEGGICDAEISGKAKHYFTPYTLQTFSARSFAALEDDTRRWSITNGYSINPSNVFREIRPQ